MNLGFIILFVQFYLIFKIGIQFSPVFSFLHLRLSQKLTRYFGGETLACWKLSGLHPSLSSTLHFEVEKSRWPCWEKSPPASC